MKTCRSILFYLLAALCVLPSAFAQSNDLVIEPHKVYRIQQHLASYQASVQDNESNYQQFDYSIQHSNQAFQFSNAIWWHKLTAVTDQKNNHNQYQIHFFNAMIDYLTVYIYVDAQLQSVSNMGDRQWSKQQDHIDIFALPGQSIEIYMKKNSDGPMIMPGIIGSSEVTEQYHSKLYFFYTLSIGGLLALSLFNAFVYSLTRKGTYGWYTGFQICSIVSFSIILGFGKGLYPAEVFNFLSNNVIVANTVLIWFVYQFSVSYLEVSNHIKWSYKIGWFIHGLTILAIVCQVLFGEQISAAVTAVLQIFVSILAYYYGIKGVKRGYKPAWFFLIAWVFILIGGAMSTLVHWNAISINFYTRHAFYFGSLIEIYLLAMALAYMTRYNQNLQMQRSYLDDDTQTPNFPYFKDKLPKWFNTLDSNKVGLALIRLEGFDEIASFLGPAAAQQAFSTLIDKINHALLESSWLVPIVGINNKKSGLALMSREELIIFYTNNNSNHQHAILSLTNDSFQYKQLKLDITAKVGSAIKETTAQSLNDLYQNAQIALNQADFDNNNFIQFDHKYQSLAIERITLINALKEAIGHADFTFAVQPQIELSSGKIVGGEVLIRWTDKQLGFVSPADFIPLAEQLGLISKITSIILTKAFDWAGKNKSALADLRLSFNISAHDLESDWLVYLVDGLIRYHNINAKHIVLEITESAVIKDPTLSVSIIKRIKQLGVHISIDDFGTGFSSMINLCDIEPDEIKIDQQFIKDIVHSDVHDKISTNVLQLTHSLGAFCVAEGVEDKETADILLTKQCEIGQGYYWSKPLPSDDFLELFQSQPFIPPS